MKFSKKPNLVNININKNDLRKIDVNCFTYLNHSDLPMDIFNA